MIAGTCQRLGGLQLHLAHELTRRARYPASPGANGGSALADIDRYAALFPAKLKCGHAVMEAETAPLCFRLDLAADKFQTDALNLLARVDFQQHRGPPVAGEAKYFTLTRVLNRAVSRRSPY